MATMPIAVAQLPMDMNPTSPEIRPMDGANALVRARNSAAQCASWGDSLIR